MNNIQKEANELYKRTMFLFRKVRNGKYYHTKQVAKVLGWLDIPEYTHIGENWTMPGRYQSYEAALLHAIADRVIPDGWKWHVEEGTTLMNSEPKLVIEWWKHE